MEIAISRWWVVIVVKTQNYLFDVVDGGTNYRAAGGDGDSTSGSEPEQCCPSCENGTE